MDQPSKRPLPYDAQDDDELFDELYSVASATECTGLIPAAPVSEASVDSYSDIYDVPLASDAGPARNDLQKSKKTSRNQGPKQ